MQKRGSDIFIALPFFYAFTEYDTISGFYGTGEFKAYGVWVKSEKKDDFTSSSQND